MTTPKTQLQEDELKIPKELPVLTLRDIVVYPFIIVPLSVSREKSIKAIDRALADNRMILLLSQKDGQIEEPGERDLYNVGTVGVIMRMLKLPDGRIRVLVQGVCRAKVDEFTQKQPFLQARIGRISETSSSDSLEQEALLRSAKRSLERSVSLGKSILVFGMKSWCAPKRILNFRQELRGPFQASSQGSEYVREVFGRYVYLIRFTR